MLRDFVDQIIGSSSETPGRRGSGRSFFQARIVRDRLKGYHGEHPGAKRRCAAVDNVESITFPSGVPQELRGILSARAVHKSLDDGDVLVRDGKECAYLPIVLKGTLRVFKNSETGKELTLYRIAPGESCILTATCILNNGSFPATAVAEGDTDVLLVPSKLLSRLVDESAQWRRFVFGLYAKRLEIVLALVEEVAFHHIDSRIAAFLLRLASGRSGFVRTTHVKIASELGTSREVVTRILKDFEAEGLIVTRRGNVEIVRPDGLKEKSGSFSGM
jgi:CRP/FNR family transcriptional regulator